ncbi:hypothetical protein A1D29_07780 [Pasteurellaceae bacterium Orientalotternb1]|nr:hypothetical protein A1D29_07780 [Pasteurellaceae bacterium Orientalotternb1]
MAKVIKPLVVQQIKNAKSGILRDGDGLFLKITDNSKTWRFSYLKPFTKKRTDIKIGTFPEMSLQEARQCRAEYRMLLAQNVDPFVHQQQKEAQALSEMGNTFKRIAVLWRDSFKSKTVMPATMHEDWRRLENHIFPELANVPVNKINARLLVEAVQPMNERGHSNALEKTLRVVVEVMDYAENTGLIEFHNCHKAHKSFYFRPAKHNPTIPPSQVPKLIEDIFQSRTKPKTKLLIFWSLLTGVRPAEVVSAEWSEIDWKNRLWNIPKEKMKGRKNEKRPHTVPLSEPAIWILEAAKTFSGQSKFVFPHFKTPYEPMSSETVNAALKRNGYYKVLTSHGIRSIIRTYFAEIGIEKNTAETVLAHKIDDDLEETYNRHSYLNQRIPVMNLWGKYLEECGLTQPKITTY